MENNFTINIGTIKFWIKKNTLIYNDNKDTVIFTIDPEGGSILMNKDENNSLHIAYVVLGRGRIDLNYDVSKLDSNIAHMVALTWNIEYNISLYIDGQLACSKKIEFPKN